MTTGRSLVALVLAALCVVPPVAAREQDVASVIAAARQALGGEAALNAVTSFTVKGSQTVSVMRAISGSVDIKVALPDRFVRVLERSMDMGPMSSVAVTYLRRLQPRRANQRRHSAGYTGPDVHSWRAGAADAG